MAKSKRKCGNMRCPAYGKPTSLLVCPECHRATVRSIYRPRRTGFRAAAAHAAKPDATAKVASIMRVAVDGTNGRLPQVEAPHARRPAGYARFQNLHRWRRFARASA